MAFPHGFKAEANRISLKVREQMGLRAVDPIDPVKICTHFEIELFKLSDLGHENTFGFNDSAFFSAVTVPCREKTAIVHNDKHHPDRQRSNICHELGHCFLGHRFAPPLTDDGQRVRDGGIEAEANFLAGALLIPNEAAIHIMRKGLLPTARKLYGVSQPMLIYRLRISGAQRINERVFNRLK